MVLKNFKTGEIMSIRDMLDFILNETEKNWDIEHSDEPWYNLTRDEQNELFYERLEHEIENGWNLEENLK